MIVRRGGPWTILAIVTMGFFMTLLDMTIVNIAIPNLITSLRASFYDVLWVINAYTLALAALLIVSGRLGDIIGQRQAFVAGVAVFTAASLACGLAPDPAWLIAFRTVQGIGAAMLMPQTLAILTMAFPASLRGTAFGIWGGVAGLATVAGPTIGGLLVTALGWPYVFFVNLPVGAVVAVLAILFVPDLRSGKRHSFDWGGVVLVGVGLLSICYGLVEGQRYNWGVIYGPITIPIVIAAGITLLVLFTWLELMLPSEPLIPFKALSSRNFAMANVISALAPIGIVGVLLPFTIYLQSVLGFSAVKAGLTMSPAPLVSMATAPLAGRLAGRTGGKFILLLGLTLFSVSIVIVALSARTGVDAYHFLGGLIIMGAGIGFTFAPMLTVAMVDIAPAMAGTASGVFNTTRQIGTVMGIGGIGALLANRLTSVWTEDSAKWATGISASARHDIVSRLVSGARGGLDLGAPAGGNAATAEIFSRGFVIAMKPTMISAAGVLLACAVCSLGIRSRPTAEAVAKKSDCQETPEPN